MTQVAKTRVKRTLKIGNDGYGGKDVTVKSDRGSIEITRTDSHDWGRVSGRVYIRKQDIKELVAFLLEQVSDK